MLEHHAHVAAMVELRTAAGAVFAADPNVAAAAADVCAAVDIDPDAATLGALIDQVVAASAADGTELDELAWAADLWTRGLELYDSLAATRQDIEAALLNPGAPDAVARLQAGIGRLDGLRTGALAVAHEAETLKQQISTMAHLDPHPRQADIAAADWSWRDAFIGRRTDAFVRGMFEQATTTRTKSLAFGVLASYASNVAGAAYLGAVTGGPRRTHRYRNRLARNAVGSWIHANHNTPSNTELAQRLSFAGSAGTPSLPADVAAALNQAFTVAYPSRPAPDLDLGLQRVVQQLKLLDVFVRPPLPFPPPATLDAGGPGGMNILSATQDLNIPTAGVGLEPDGTPTQPGLGDSHKSGGGACLAILLAIITVGIALLIYCIGKWTTGKKCKASDFVDEFQGSQEPDPTAPTGISQQQLTELTDPDAAAHVVRELFNVQMLLWQGFDAALAYLAVAGLVPPDDLLLPSPLYQQFLKTPPRELWPLLEEPDPIETYHLDPSSNLELTETNSPFPPGHTPASFLVSWSSGPNTGTVGLGLLGQILRGDQDSTNYDLDADRGWVHPCWDLTAGTSITDPTLSVEILPYGSE
jgi:hypothetical protein